MEQNNKTLLIAVLIILLALVAFNFNKISGSAVSDGSDVSVVVTPSVIAFSGNELLKRITVTVDTGAVGVDNQVRLYSVKDNYRRATTLADALCGTQNVCKGVISIQFDIPSTLQSGDYVIRTERSTTAHNFEVDSNIFSVNHVG